MKQCIWGCCEDSSNQAYDQLGRVVALQVVLIGAAVAAGHITNTIVEDFQLPKLCRASFSLLVFVRRKS